ncbi:MAG: hypothetical protein M8357_13890 [Desulfobulbaceae bacterium]|nr:hypothetical protein [Desulfobulbaceae bacterium]
MNTPYRSCFVLLGCIALCAMGATSARAVPVNDNFADAALIEGDTGTMSGDNIDATTEINEPSYQNSGTNACSSVWYQWTAPSTEEYYFNTFGSNFDTILAVYTGTAIDELSAVFDNDDYNFLYLQSRLFFSATAGTTYHIVVDGLSCDQGLVALNWGPSSLLPANDNFDFAEPISGDTGTASGTNINATPEGGEDIHHINNDAPYSSIWFAWTAPADGDFIFDTFGSDFDTILAVYTGTTVDGLTRLKDNDDEGSGLQSRVVFSATGGTIYHIAIDGYQGLQGSVALNWQELAQLPPNDNFGDATPISGETGSTTAYTFLASTETGEPSHGDANGPYASIWFAWTAPFSGKAVFDTFGSDFDTTMAAYTGTAVDGLTRLKDNDDADTGIQSRITFPVLAGTTYYIAVDGYDNSQGNVVLNWDKKSPWILFIPAVTGGSRQQEKLIRPTGL